eukprot:CAMPEP_0117565834 /NCGR_PEP_ID=MMETSP0784-20121206/56778_1 /TAXON_ID=39447 /ORGANISM="" /LENGTH=501 /DNA_ID=CAMNT_0005363651 /DNA_START=103 /DNA_END=1603 /DNA_ORIENTATION=-
MATEHVVHLPGPVPPTVTDAFVPHRERASIAPLATAETTRLSTRCSTAGPNSESQRLVKAGLQTILSLRLPDEAANAAGSEDVQPPRAIHRHTSVEVPMRTEVRANHWHTSVDVPLPTEVSPSVPLKVDAPVWSSTPPPEAEGERILHVKPRCLDSSHHVPEPDHDERDESAVLKASAHVIFAIALGIFIGVSVVAFFFLITKITQFHRAGARLGARWLQTATSIAGSESDTDPGTCTDGLGGRSPMLPRNGATGVIFAVLMVIGTAGGSSIASCGSAAALRRSAAAGGYIATKICLAMGSPVPLHIGAYRVLISSFYVGSGNALGIEAPALHISAVVASTLHEVATRISRRFKPLGFVSENLPQAVVLGCAAGLSAAFGSPLAAISYAVEEYVDVRQTGALILLSSLVSSLVRHFCQNWAGAAWAVSTPVSATLLATACAGATTPAPQATADSQTVFAWRLLAAATIGVIAGTLSPLHMAMVLRLRDVYQTQCGGRLEVV